VTANPQKIKVGIIGFESNEDFFGYELHSFNPESYFDDEPVSFKRALSRGVHELKSKNLLYTADGLDRLYRSRDPGYMKMVKEFTEKFRDFDLLILSRFNPIHPEILQYEVPGPTKILGFIDDPGASYTRGVPYLWAFDGAFHISPSYDEFHSFENIMDEWGCRHHRWWPHGARHIEPDYSDEFYRERDLDLVYVGGSYGDKTNKLKQLKAHYGDRFLLHGRWPLRGCHGFVRGFLGRPFFFYKVTSLSEDEKRNVYTRCKIGFNLHLSDVPRESGNMRMYEVPAHGMMLVCDKAGLDLHQAIFKDGAEAIFYDDLDDAIEKIDYYLAEDGERMRIARAGHRKVSDEFWWEDKLRDTLDWAWQIRKQRSRDGA
jgi:hypothetical protein